jgi:hypothetical protein
VPPPRAGGSTTVQRNWGYRTKTLDSASLGDVRGAAYPARAPRVGGDCPRYGSFQLKRARIRGVRRPRRDIPNDDPVTHPRASCRTACAAAGRGVRDWRGPKPKREPAPRRISARPAGAQENSPPKLGPARCAHRDRRYRSRFVSRSRTTSYVREYSPRSKRCARHAGGWSRPPMPNADDSSMSCARLWSRACGRSRVNSRGCAPRSAR